MLFVSTCFLQDLRLSQWCSRSSSLLRCAAVSLGSRSRTRPHIPYYLSLHTSCQDESLATNFINCSTRVLVELVCMTEDLELDIWLGLEIFPSFTAARLDLGPAHSPIEWVSRHFFKAVKRSGREPDHSSHLVSRLRMHGTFCPLTQLLN